MKIVILDGSAANPGDISWKALEELGEVTAYDIHCAEAEAALLESIVSAEAKAVLRRLYLQADSAVTPGVERVLPKVNEDICIRGGARYEIDDQVAVCRLIAAV